MPTQNRWKTAWLSGLLRSQAYTMPTRAYISLHDFEANWLTCRNHLACLKNVCLLTVLKFSREFSANQRANDCYST